MSWEKQEEIREKAAEEAQFLWNYDKVFSGLSESDFKTSTEGATWQSRPQLAGCVARRLSDESDCTFTSWDIYRWPVAFLTHRENYLMAAFKDDLRKAKFTIELDDQTAYYGFYVEKFDEPMDEAWDWRRLMGKLRADEGLCQTIAQAADRSIIVKVEAERR